MVLRRFDFAYILKYNRVSNSESHALWFGRSQADAYAMLN